MYKVDPLGYRLQPELRCRRGVDSIKDHMCCRFLQEIVYLETVSLPMRVIMKKRMKEASSNLH